MNQSNSRGNTALHEAARWNNVGMVDALLQHRASVSARNHQSLTPMQLAQVSLTKNIASLPWNCTAPYSQEPENQLWLALFQIL